jgi:cation:H+ antiporter
MSLEANYGLFVCGLVLMVGGSIWLSRGLQQLEPRFGISPGLMGLITALGANSPEISSAMAALVSGEAEIGMGVVLGSNLFNLAGLLGISAVLSGGFRIKRRGLLVNGAASLLVTLDTLAFLLGTISAIWFFVLLCFLFGVYLLILLTRPSKVKGLPLPPFLSHLLRAIIGETQKQAREERAQRREERESTPKGFGKVVLITLISLVAIILGSIGIVHASVKISSLWAIPRSLVGIFVLAPLTGFPNCYTSARLALRKKGQAVVSETFNSNTINIVIGIGIPAIVFGFGQVKAFSILEVWWLLGMTGLSLLLPVWKVGYTRGSGVLVITVYLMFAAVRLFVW